jgi:hypothetical protein
MKPDLALFLGLRSGARSGSASRLVFQVMMEALRAGKAEMCSKVELLCKSLVPKCDSRTVLRTVLWFGVRSFVQASAGSSKEVRWGWREVLWRPILMTAKSYGFLEPRTGPWEIVSLKSVLPSTLEVIMHEPSLT